MERPNFVVFVTDQHPWDHLGCAGHPALKTPNIDSLAENGIRFERAYTIHPLCMPTRATWFTGQTPRGHRTRCNGIPLSTSVPTIMEALRRDGYATHSIGKIHLRPFCRPRGQAPEVLDPAEWCECRAMWNLGRIERIPTPYYGLESVEFLGAHGASGLSNYTQWLFEREPDGMRLMNKKASQPFGEGVECVWRMALPAELHYTSWMVECAERFLRDRAEDNRPFFLWWSAPDPHPPYAAPEPWSNLYGPEDMPMPRRREGELDDLPPHYRMFFEKGGRSAGRFAPTKVPDEYMLAVRATVCGMISQVDSAVGRVLESLDLFGLREKTVVVFMSDHGQMLGDHWMFSMPPTHFDSVVRVPCIWSVPGGRKAVVSDALVSHLDFAPTVLELAGVKPLEGEVPPKPEAPNNFPVLRGRSILPIIKGERREVQDSVIIENDEDYIPLRLRTLVTKDFVLTCYLGEPYGELYDLRKDPDQLHNLWGDPGYQRVKVEHEAGLFRKLAETDSVLPRRLSHA